MDRIRQLRDQHRVAWRVGVVALAVPLFLGAFVLFAFGGCHDVGGFCAGEFSSTHVGFYAMAAVLGACACLVAATMLTLRVAVLTAAAGAGAALVVLAAVLGESSA